MNPVQLAKGKVGEIFRALNCLESNWHERVGGDFVANTSLMSNYLEGHVSHWGDYEVAVVDTEGKVIAFLCSGSYQDRPQAYSESPNPKSDKEGSDVQEP